MPQEGGVDRAARRWEELEQRGEHNVNTGPHSRNLADPVGEQVRAHQYPCAAIVKLMQRFVCGVERVHVGDDSACPQRPEQRDYVSKTVGCLNGDHLARLEIVTINEEAGEVVRPGGDLSIGQRCRGAVRQHDRTAAARPASRNRIKEIAKAPWTVL